MRSISCLLVVAALAGAAFADSRAYTKSAGTSAPMVDKPRTVRGDDGVDHTVIVHERADQDRWGNANGNEHDLAVDGAFEGQTIAVIQLYTIDFDFHLPREALKEKGFSVYRWSNQPPTPAELEQALAKSCELWLISGDHQMLTDEHVKVIKKFFDAGHGVYIWGDNQPYYADANLVARALFDTEMLGDLPGNQTVGLQKQWGHAGLLANHLLTTGLEHIYEGITIATIQPSKTLQPLIYGSADNLVTAYYDHDGKRAILDGGFTRLYMSWDTAGTARYVKNAAAWLVNAERFGDSVVSPKLAAASTSTNAPTPAKLAAPTVTTTSPTTTIRAMHTLDVMLPSVLAMLAALVLGGVLIAFVRPRLRRRVRD